MSQAKRIIEIDVTPQQFFEVITDFAAYPKFLDEVGMLSSRILKQSDTVVEVESKVKTMGLTETYSLRYRLDESLRLSWSLIKGKLTKANDGSWELEEIDGGRTRANYAVEASFGWMVPKALIKMGLENQLPKMLEAFKKRAESIHK
jgi:coenzyme Q-binding protein COQ10